MTKITHAKPEVGISANTIRAFFKQGLRCYKVGKLCFFSKAELEHFLRSKAA